MASRNRCRINNSHQLDNLAMSLLAYKNEKLEMRIVNWLFAGVLLGFAHGAAASTFTIGMLYRLDGMAEDTALFTPPWILLNTSTESLDLSGLTIDVDFGSIPVLAPNFERRNFYTILQPGESIGSSNIPYTNSFLSEPLPIPTYTVSDPISFGGDFAPGSGEGSILFSIGDSSVLVPIIISVTPGKYILQGGVGDAYISGTFSAVPLPGALLLFLSGIPLLLTQIRRH